MAANGEPARPQPVVLTITFDPATQQLHVEGVPQSTIIAYGMLELALDIVRGMRAKPVARSPIVIPPRLLG